MLGRKKNVHNIHNDIPFLFEKFQIEKVEMVLASYNKT